MNTPRKCLLCDWEGKDTDLNAIEDLQERVAPGELYPAGECPDCGFLIGCSDNEALANAWPVLRTLLVQRGWTIVDPQLNLPLKDKK